MIGKILLVRKWTSVVFLKQIDGVNVFLYSTSSWLEFVSSTFKKRNAGNLPTFLNRLM